MSETKIAQRTLLLAAGLSIFLALLKLGAYLLTGSAIVLASFLDSLFDSLTSLINRFINKKSLEEADKEHPFGHGGFEVVGSLIQGLLLVFLALSLLRESLHKLWAEHVVVLDGFSSLVAIGVLVFSALAGWAIHLYFTRQERKMRRGNVRSLSLLADQAHYSGDAITNGVSALGLVIIYVSEWWALDAVFGCVAALMLGWVAFPILRKTIDDIVHSEAPRELQQGIVEVASEVDTKIRGVRRLRSRHFGPSLFVDFHLLVDGNLLLREAHAISAKVSAAIKATYPLADVIIHLDPAD